MNRDNIKKVLALCVDSICDDCPYDDTKNCYNQIKLDARKLIIEQETEIAQLKADNARLTAKLGQVLLSIDIVKDINIMRNIEEQVKQAKIDVLNELKKKKSIAAWDIDEMIEELIKNAEDKS